MNTFSLAHATAWLSECAPNAHLADFAAMLAIGTAPAAFPLKSLEQKLGVSPAWIEEFLRRQASYRGGLAPFIQVRQGAHGAEADLTVVGRNILNQFWQRASDERDLTPAQPLQSIQPMPR